MLLRSVQMLDMISPFEEKQTYAKPACNTFFSCLVRNAG